MKRIILGTSVRGASHIRSGTECQDSHKELICDDGTIIMSIADGHGSKNCPFSMIGADIAVDVFCETIAKYLENFSKTPDMLLTYLNREGDTAFAQIIETRWKERVFDDYKHNRCELPEPENMDSERQPIYDQYGTTLLGVMIAEDYIFAFQIGDGDIAYISEESCLPVIVADRILGVETHSLCKEEAWKNAITTVRRIDLCEKLPAMFMMSTDGFANSYPNEDEFTKTCVEYFNAVNSYGDKTVSENLEHWLSETSTLGCGDDITVLMAYFASDVAPCVDKICANETPTSISSQMSSADDTIAVKDDTSSITSGEENVTVDEQQPKEDTITSEDTTFEVHEVSPDE